MKRQYAIDYRNMHNAIHGLLIFNTYARAMKFAGELRTLERSSENADINECEYNDTIEEIFSKAIDHIEEINFRSINETGEYVTDNFIYNVVNQCAIDLYL